MSGLDRVDALKPGQGYAEFLAGVRGAGRDVVGFARGELGARLTPALSLFGFGEVTVGTQAPPAWMAGIGGRVTW